jgi:hypothetical protein
MRGDRVISSVTRLNFTRSRPIYHTKNFNAMPTANIDPVLLEHAIVLNAIDTADPVATVRYDMMSDALIWSDETTPDMPIELIWSLRIVFNYRTHLIRGTKIDDTSVWDYYNSIFPRWIGFAPNRRTATTELLDLYRRCDVSMRWCLRRLEGESETDDG